PIFHQFNFHHQYPPTIQATNVKRNTQVSSNCNVHSPQPHQTTTCPGWRGTAESSTIFLSQYSITFSRTAVAVQITTTAAGVLQSRQCNPQLSKTRILRPTMSHPTFRRIRPCCPTPTISSSFMSLEMLS